MAEELRIVSVEEPPWAVVGGGISSYNDQHAGDDNAQHVSFVLQTPDGQAVGGVIGVVYWDWFSVELMWMEEEYRGQGYGHRLLTLAEEKARDRGARHVHLDTFSFQAPAFYEKHGYEVFGELQDFPAGHLRYYMRKDL
ncbi:MAG: GNAT family N-acetyltransferase [Anaerolineae bacterium]|jgi:GNAT superfamily N-acetyltransferase